MAQTGYTPISLYYTTTASAVPTAGNLVAGELAINTNDGKLFYKDSSGVVQTIASKAGNVNVSSFSAGSTGLTPNTATTGAVTLAGTLNVSSGGTGLTSLTAGYIPYGNGTSAFSNSASFNFSGTRLQIAGATSSYNAYDASGTGDLIPFYSGTPSTSAGSHSIWLGSYANVSYGTKIKAIYNYGSSNQAAMSFETCDGSSLVEAMRITAAGNVGIGTSAPRAPLAFAATISTAGVPTKIRLFDDGASNLYGFGISSGLLDIVGGTGGGVAIYTNGANERMRIDSSGNLLVNTTSAVTTTVGSRLMYGATDPYISSTLTASTNATTSYLLYSTGAGAYRFYVGMGGTIYATSIVISAISDERLKENIKDIDTGLNSIMALKPRRFDWKDGKGQDKKNVAGFIAQEFETVFPECVSTSKAGEDGIEYKNINHETLIPTLVKAIQEQQTMIETLTTRLNALEGK
jgi:hypothetical protein